MKKNKGIQTEIDASYLYQQLANHEEDPTIADVYRQMSEIEKSHAKTFAQKEKIALEYLMQPSWRARVWNRIGKIFGYDYVLGSLMDTEKSISNAVITTKEARKLKLTGAETTHVNILRAILEKQS